MTTRFINKEKQQEPHLPEGDVRFHKVHAQKVPDQGQWSGPRGILTLALIPGGGEEEEDQQTYKSPQQGD